jgi:hypothetical protein
MKFDKNEGIFMPHNNSRKQKNVSEKFDILSLKSEGYQEAWINEYNMMRSELVDYMNMLQSVRNMMYIGVSAAFAFAFSDKSIFICSFLPLVFILPSYQCAVNYWNCVRKASAYLVVFHESYNDCPCHWESRHNMYRQDLFFVFKSKGESYNVLLADFLAIKNNEVQTAIGKCWQNGRSIMNADKKHKEDTKLDEYLKVIAKYL